MSRQIRRPCPWSGAPDDRSAAAARPGIRRAPDGAAGGASERHQPQAVRQWMPNANIVVELNALPGFSTVDGKFGWLGEFGKCCVSNVYAAPCR
jgi:hypothetical protein